MIARYNIHIKGIQNTCLFGLILWHINQFRLFNAESGS